MKNSKFRIAAVALSLVLSLRAYPQEVTAWDCLLEAARSYAASDIDRAGSLFTRALEADPQMDAACYYLGLIAESKGDAAEAERYFAGAMALDTANFWYMDALAGFYTRADSIRKAVPIYLRMYERYPGRATPQCHLVLGDWYRSRSMDTLAVKHYDDLLAMNPGYTPVHFNLAEIYRMRGNFYQYFKHLDIVLEDPCISPSFKAEYLDQAVLTPQFVGAFKPQVDTMILCILKAHPQDSSVLRTAASYYMRSDERDRGIELYRRNMELYPEDRAVNIEYVSLLYYLEQWEEVISNVRRMMKLFPDDDTLPEILASAQWHLDDLEGAMETYMRQLRMTKNPSIRLSCCTALGDICQKTGQMKKAGSWYRKGLSIDPEYIPLLNNYAYYLCTIGKDYKKGLEMSRKTIVTEPDNPTYLDTYGWLLYLTGAYEDAKVRFKRAMMFGGQENGVILDHYADVLWALKEYDMAFIYYEKAARLDPTLDLSGKIQSRHAELGR